MRFFLLVFALGLLLTIIFVSSEGRCLVWEKGISGFFLFCANCRYITGIQLPKKLGDWVDCEWSSKAEILTIH